MRLIELNHSDEVNTYTDGIIIVQDTVDCSIDFSTYTQIEDKLYVNKEFLENGGDNVTTFFMEKSTIYMETVVGGTSLNLDTRKVTKTYENIKEWLGLLESSTGIDVKLITDMQSITLD